MPTTPVYNLPYPLAADTPDVPRDIANLANAVETALTSVKNGLQAQITALANRMTTAEGKITDLYTKVPTARVSWGSKLVDFSTAGHGTLAHAAGFIPSVVIVTPRISNDHDIILTQRADVPATASSAYLRAFDASAKETATGSGEYHGKVYGGSVYVNYILRD